MAYSRAVPVMVMLLRNCSQEERMSAKIRRNQRLVEKQGAEG